MLSPRFFQMVSVGDWRPVKVLNVLLGKNQAAELVRLHHYSHCYYSCMQPAETLLCTDSAYKVNQWIIITIIIPEYKSPCSA